ncbi:hypothetical protein NQ315_012424 [Exocentrus adspersus]|uniref:Uncharacterized protein n=1 Tax=Exocentrus adspersus TaxID=1586481 RepID=A0AAV8VME6_9CUCU|nr:hypothetical protein NQ315_012424 [Exocentrus adspersus]
MELAAVQEIISVENVKVPGCLQRCGAPIIKMDLRKVNQMSLLAFKPTIPLRNLKIDEKYRILGIKKITGGKYVDSLIAELEEAQTFCNRNRAASISDAVAPHCPAPSLRSLTSRRWTVSACSSAASGNSVGRVCRSLGGASVIHW